MTGFLTINIHTFNEENNIEESIKSAKLLSDTVQIIDMESTDKTVTIAKRFGIKVLALPQSRYVEPAREFGIRKVTTDWVFILDADERLTPQLAEEIKKAVSSNEYSYYKIPRKNLFGKMKWLKYGNWWPDYQIRLINKNHFEKWPKEIHSTPQIEGKQGFLNEPLLHFFHGDLEQMVNKTILFEDIESDLLFKANRMTSTPIFFRKYFGELYRRLLRHFGFLDGSIGIIEGIYQAFSKTITYLFLYEKKSRSV